MPNLPAITINNQAHYDRVVAAFPGTTNAEKAAAYQQWSINRLIERVEAVESRAIDEEMNEEKQTRMAALRASIPEKFPEPPLP